MSILPKLKGYLPIPEDIQKATYHANSGQLKIIGVFQNRLSDSFKLFL
ncbi:hypothetical protein [Aggregatimonas sangjinii]|nr:hypothetical protein [Aggregatimonas sangjinii]